ncbi:putative Na+/H+ antiporter [Rubellicoccus peritrichatus]|uniref:Na+/H+ antiporter n=1 Tax=Rubellicoccus peritrichatus TaxID=3080537 RepID=A0AAQ3QUL9_9BACT|nr:putative Na+/H+ antiporter [Puniceicoccus sp. CR14]WOO39887.1 putative Na+/H+ antiporter [Puniceicoccus sp. CR14]
MFKGLITVLGFLICGMSFSFAAGGSSNDKDINFPISEATYIEMEKQEAEKTGKPLSLTQQLILRAKADPFNVVATLIFFFAVMHTFLAAKFNKMAHKYEHLHQYQVKNDTRVYVEGKEPVSLRATLFHFLGEIEAIFGIWLIPLLIALVIMEPNGMSTAAFYIDSRNYTEPVFVVIIMAIASSRPVIQMAEGCLRQVASIGKKTPAAWWLSILIIAPLLGSFITEPAAMTIAALLLGHQFYVLKPSAKFKYGTLGLLFVNISVGGTLTHFAAPPVLMVASKWHWNMPYMFTHFGWRAILGILIATAIYYVIFKREFAGLKGRAEELAAEKGNEPTPEPAPGWIIFVHMAFVAWTVLTLHHPAFFIGGFLFFLAFTMATQHHQYEIKLKGPLLVGFFLAGLVTHGGLQGWWISPVLTSLTEVPLFIGATVLTAFNDNAAITFLAAQVPAFNPDMFVGGQWISKTGDALAAAKGLEYAVVAGAVTGGGLTVIANAPNPAGQSILSKYFPDGISPIKLLLGALFPTIIMACCFMVLPH